jgi:antitoxin component YwqK of YwqJK toxin-antitoxin module
MIEKYILNIYLIYLTQMQTLETYKNLINNYAIDNKLNGKLIINTKDKEYGYMVNEKKEGLWMTWTNFYCIKTFGNYVNNKKNGLWQYFGNSTHKILNYSINYINDIKHGTATYYDGNGHLQETGEYFNDKKIGVWQTWNNCKLISNIDYGIITETNL